MKLRFEFDEQAILGTATSRSALSSQIVTLPMQVRSMQALGSHLRGQSWGKWLVTERLAFMVTGAEVSDCTDSLVGEKVVEVTLASHLYAKVDGVIHEETTTGALNDACASRDAGSAQAPQGNTSGGVL